MLSLTHLKLRAALASTKNAKLKIKLTLQKVTDGKRRGLNTKLNATAGNQAPPERTKSNLFKGLSPATEWQETRKSFSTTLKIKMSVLL